MVMGGGGAGYFFFWGGPTTTRQRSKTCSPNSAMGELGGFDAGRIRTHPRYEAVNHDAPRRHPPPPLSGSSTARPKGADRHADEAGQSARGSSRAARIQGLAKYRLGARVCDGRFDATNEGDSRKPE